MFFYIASAIRRVKTYLRSTVSEARLSNLFVMLVHKDKTDNLTEPRKLFIVRCKSFVSEKIDSI